MKQCLFSYGHSAALAFDAKSADRQLCKAVEYMRIWYVRCYFLSTGKYIVAVVEEYTLLHCRPLQST